jgi:large subunit ribosomal protein L17
MKKQVFGRKFKRTVNQRNALFSGLISSMILKGRISTTYEKAKAIRPDLEKMVTKAKKDEATARRLLNGSLKPFEQDLLITKIAPKFKDRPGGYTRIIKTGKRFNDNATMVIMEWSEPVDLTMESTKPKVKKNIPEKEVKEAKTKRSLGLRRPLKAKTTENKKEKK